MSLGQAYVELGVKDNMSSSIIKLQDTVKGLKSTVENLSGGFGKVGKDTDVLNSKVSNIQNTFSGLKSTFIAIGGLFVFKQLLTEVGNFERALIDAKNVAAGDFAGGLKDPLLIQRTKELSKGLKEISDKTGVSREELGKMSVSALKLGISIKDGSDGVLKFVESITKIQKLQPDFAGGNADEAANKVAKLNNILGNSAGNTLALVSSISATSDASTASADGISDLLLRYGAFGKAVGATDSELIGLSGTLIDVGLSTEVSGTAVNDFFSKIKTNGEDFVGVIGKMNPAIKETFEKQIKTNGVQALKTFTSELSKMTVDDQVKALDKLGLTGSGTLRTMLALGQGARSVGGEMSIFDKNINAAAKGFTNLDGFNKKYLATLDGVNAKMGFVGNQFKNMGLDIIEKLLPAIVSLMTMFQSILSSESFSALLDKITSGIGILVNIIGTYLIPAFQSILNGGLSILTPALQILGGTLEFIFGLFSSVGSAVGLSKSSFEGLGTVLQILGGILGGLGIAYGIYNGIQIIGTALTTAWTVAQSLLNAAFLANPIGLVVAGIIAVLGGLYVAYQTNFLGMADAVNEAWYYIKIFGEAFNIIFTEIGKYLSGFTEWFSGVWNDFYSWRESNTSAMLDAVLNIFTFGLYGILKEFGVLGKVSSYIGSRGSGIEIKFSDIINTILNIVTFGLYGVVSKFASAFNQAYGITNKISALFGQAKKNVDLSGTIKSSIGFTNNLVSAIKSIPPVPKPTPPPPAPKPAPTGGGGGGGGGAKKQADEVSGAMKTLSDSFKKGEKDLDTLVKKLADGMDKFKNAVKDTMKELENGIQKSKDKIVDVNKELEKGLATNKLKFAEDIVGDKVKINKELETLSGQLESIKIVGAVDIKQSIADVNKQMSEASGDPAKMSELNNQLQKLLSLQFEGGVQLQKQESFQTLLNNLVDAKSEKEKAIAQGQIEAFKKQQDMTEQTKSYLDVLEKIALKKKELADVETAISNNIKDGQGIDLAKIAENAGLEGTAKKEADFKKSQELLQAEADLKIKNENDLITIQEGFQARLLAKKFLDETEYQNFRKDILANQDLNQEGKDTALKLADKFKALGDEKAAIEKTNNDIVSLKIDLAKKEDLLNESKNKKTRDALAKEIKDVEATIAQYQRLVEAKTKAFGSEIQTTTAAVQTAVSAKNGTIQPATLDLNGKTPDLVSEAQTKISSEEQVVAKKQELRTLDLTNEQTDKALRDQAKIVEREQENIAVTLFLEQIKQKYFDANNTIRATQKQTTDMAIQGLYREMSVVEQSIQSYYRLAAAKNAAGSGGFFKGGFTSGATGIPGFATGGYTGSFDIKKIAGVVHGGEYVIPNKVLKKLAPTGLLGTLERMRKGFFDGGYTNQVGGAVSNAVSNSNSLVVNQTVNDYRDAESALRQISQFYKKAQ